MSETSERNLSRSLETISYARGEVYSSLALSFSQPTTEIFEKTTKNGLVHALKNYIKLFSATSFEGEVKELEKSLENNFSEIDDQKLHNFAVEYNRLFFGPRHVLVPPYESVYKSANGLVMGEAAVDVLRKYREEGLVISPDFKNLPDHVVVELEFMGHLCIHEAEACANGDSEKAVIYLRREESFLNEHLTTWIPDFSKRLTSSIEWSFYRVIAKIVRKFVSLDHRQVCVILNALKTPTEMKTNEGT